MSNLQKFNQTLEEFNLEVEQLKEVSGAYKKFQQLVEVYLNLLEQFDTNNRILGSINEVQRSQQEKLNSSLAELQSLHKQNKLDLLQVLEEKTDQIRKDNKEFYRELESTIKIKLEDNRSQIKQLIESERTQIKQIFEIEFAKNTKELSQIIKEEGDKQTKQNAANHLATRLWLWIIGGLILTVCVLTVIKLWKT